MTSQKDQIQRLIAEIEATLAKPSARLPLGLSGEAERQRQLLGKLFSYLQSLQQLFDSPGGWGPIDPGTGQLVAPQAAVPDVEESASQVLQGLLLEMRYLRENSLKPMRQELESLQQKRDSLQAEINVLEAQRGADPLQSERQISAFLETLMQRLQEQLSAQMAQNFAALETASVEQLSAADNPVPLLSGQRLEQVRLLQAQSDQLLLKLDTTLTAVFDSLQKSVDSYRESLEEGLDQMHGLGRQGEVIFHAFVNHLAQQLGQDASSYLTGDLGQAGRQAALQEPGSATTDVDLDAIQLDELDQALENLALEESIEESAAELELDPDLVLLENAIAPEDDEDSEDEDITLIQTNDISEQAPLEEAISEAISFDESIFDEDITVIQPDDNLNQGIEIDLDEEITLIQTDDNSEVELLEEAILSSEDSSAVLTADIDAGVDLNNPPPQPTDEEVEAVSLDEAPATFSLDLPLEDIDESLGLLAVGADSNELLSVDETNDELNQDGLPSVDSEGELFSFDVDTDFDLGLESVESEEDEEEPADLLAGTLFPNKPQDSETLANENDVLTFDLTDSADSGMPPLEAERTAEADLVDSNQIADDWLFERSSVGGIDSDAMASLSGPRWMI